MSRSDIGTPAYPAPQVPPDGVIREKPLELMLVQ
jgi:hypothetical protein